MHLTRAVVWARASASQGHSPVSGAGPAGFCGLAETAAGCCFGCGASASRLPGRQEDRGQYHKELKCDMGLLQRNGIQLLPAGHTGGEHTLTTAVFACLLLLCQQPCCLDDEVLAIHTMPGRLFASVTEALDRLVQVPLVCRWWWLGCTTSLLSLA